MFSVNLLMLDSVVRTQERFSSDVSSVKVNSLLLCGHQSFHFQSSGQLNHGC